MLQNVCQMLDLVIYIPGIIYCGIHFFFSTALVIQSLESYNFTCLRIVHCLTAIVQRKAKSQIGTQQQLGNKASNGSTRTEK